MLFLAQILQFFLTKLRIVFANFGKINFRGKMRNFATKFLKCARNFCEISQKFSFAGNPTINLTFLLYIGQTLLQFNSYIELNKPQWHFKAGLAGLIFMNF